MPWLASLHDDSRSAERHSTGADATLRIAEQYPVDVLIANLSTTGCLFLCQSPIEVEAVVSIGIAGLGRLPARIVRAEGTRYGAEFIVPLTAATISTALAGPSDSVIPFPLWAPTMIVSTDDAPASDKLPMATRVAIVSGLALVSWIGLIGGLKLLF